MKILILTNNFGGLHSFRKEVVKELRDNNYEVIISAPFDEKAVFFKELGCKLVDTQFNRKGTNPVKDIALLFFYKKLIKQIAPDIVLSYTIKPNIYGGIACRLCSVPQLANITGLGSAVENPGWLQLLTIYLYKVGLKKTHTVFFQNKANQEFCLKHGMVKGKFFLLPGSGVNLQYHALQQYPVDNDPLRFIFISRLLKEKGINEYLIAAEAIRAKHQNVEFHVLGPSEEEYEAKIDELQKRKIVIYHGEKPDVRPYIGKCHCTVHPSFYPEGMSNVLLESCAAGRPIITTNRPGCGEIVDNGNNGFIVKQQDSNDLIEKIEMFIALPYAEKRKMGIAARAKVEKEFDRQIVVDAYMSEIQHIAYV